MILYYCNVNNYSEQTEIYFNIHDVTLVATKTQRKAIPSQAWTGPEGSRRLSLPHFDTIST
jgi:hypothetical protein